MPRSPLLQSVAPRNRPARDLGRGFIGLVALGLAAALVHRLVAEVGWAEVHARLAAASPWGVALAAVLVALHLVFWSWRLRLAVARIAHEPGIGVVFLSLVGTATLNLLLPFARVVAVLLRARHLALASRPPHGKRVFLGVVMFDQLLHLITMSVLTYAGLTAAALLIGRPELFWGLTGGAAAFVAVLSWAWHRHRGVVRAWLERRLAARAGAAEGLTSHAVEGGKSAARILLSLAGDSSLYGPSLALGAGVFVAGAAAQWVAFAALGVPVHPLAVAVTVSLGQAAGVLFGTPGGLGATEATMIATFGLFGVGRAEAASAVLLFRGLHYAVVLGLGLPALAALELRFARRGERPAE